jgi:hypothetical protein
MKGGAEMTTRHINTEHRRFRTSRKGDDMQHHSIQLALVRDYHARLRAEREADRLALASARSIRSQLGESIIRLGQRVAGERLGSPALTG